MEKAGDEVGILEVAGVADAESWVEHASSGRDLAPALSALCARGELGPCGLPARPIGRRGRRVGVAPGEAGALVPSMVTRLTGARAAASAAWDRLAARRTEIELVAWKVP